MIVLPAMLKQHLKAAATLSLAAAVLFISGCVSQESVPQDYFYRLPVIHPASTSPVPAINGSVAVDQFNADGVYRERPLIYVDAERPLEVLQYHYRHWIRTPSSLIQESLIDYLREANLAESVERYAGNRRPDLLITGRLQKFERVVEKDNATAVVEIEVEFRSKSQNEQVKRGKIYASEARAQGPSIHETVTAFGEALRGIYEEMRRDLDAAGK